MYKYKIFYKRVFIDEGEGFRRQVSQFVSSKIGR